MTVGHLVDREQRQLKHREVLAGALFAAGALALGIGLGAILLGGSRWLALPRGIPLLLWAVLAVLLGWVAVRTRARLRRDGSRVRVARAIEDEQGLRRGQLVGVLELEGRGALASRAAGITRGALPTAGSLAPQMRRASSRRTATAAGVAGAGLLVLATASPLFGDGLRAVMRPLDAWRGALLERLKIEDAPAELLRGSPLRVRVRAPGRRSVVLSVRQTGEAWKSDTLVVDSSGTARWTLDALRGDVRLVATDGRATSDSVVVRAADRPFLGAVQLRASYPAYLGRAPEVLPVGEPLRLPVGTVLDISGRASVPLDGVRLAGGGAVHDLAVNGHRFEGRLVASRSARLEWSARGTGGIVPDLPPALDIEALADSAPRVEITIPTGDTLLVSGDSAELALGATDDHGLAVVRLRVVRGATTSLVAVGGVTGTTWVGRAGLDLASLSLGAGDAVRVRAEAVDASPWAQVGTSREVTIRRATRDEIRANARALGDSAVQAARAAVGAQQALAQRTDEAARTQARSSSSASGQERSSAAQGATPQTMSYENAEKARALAEQQRAMAARVDKLRDATRQLEQQLKAAGALDSALARQLAEAQALLRQAMTPEMMAQMQKLESASQQQDGQQARDALRDLARMQQQLREQLEKSAQMLERAASEGAMQTLGDQARELAAREHALADSTRAGTPQDKHEGAPQNKSDGQPQDKKAEAAKLAAQSQQLKDAISELQSRLEKSHADAGASRTQQAAQHAASSDSAMQRAAEAMKKDGDGRQQMREGANQMDRTAQAMQDARAAQVKEWKQELTSALDQGVQEMLQLAQQERALEQQARNGQQADERKGAQSAVEQGVERASQRLDEAGRKSALVTPRSQRAMQEAKQKVSEATRSMSQSPSAGAQQAGALGDAADALTKAAASLARDREGTNSANSASGFSEMLQQMQQAAQKQGQINSQAQSLFSMPGGTPSSQSLARQLARAQRSVADQLDDAGNAAGGDKAAQFAQEARRLAEALEGGRLDAGTLARQQQLFRRLLDAGRSLEKEDREDTGKREATSATGNNAFTPAGTVQSKAAVRFPPPRWEELRSLPADERRAILDYFTRLNSAPSP